MNDSAGSLAHTGWSIRKFVKTARRYRTIEIQAGRQTITAAKPLPADLREALDSIGRRQLTCALGWPNSGLRFAAKSDHDARMTARHIGSGPYCSANNLAMVLGPEAPSPAVIEMLTGSPLVVIFRIVPIHSS